jgi:hypothetical protein
MILTSIENPPKKKITINRSLIRKSFSWFRNGWHLFKIISIFLQRQKSSLPKSIVMVPFGHLEFSKVK